MYTYGSPLHPRVIPCLLLKGEGLVKTKKFKDPTYLGDPRNIVRIFNEKEVDELILLDINASMENKGPNFELIHEIASECFMPLGYGGGITSTEEIRRLLGIGLEKVVLNTSAIRNPSLITEAAKLTGSSSVVVSMDVKRNLFGGVEVYVKNGTKGTGLSPSILAKRVEDAGAGEIFLNSIDRDGMMSGYDIEMIRNVSESVKIPVIACGGAASVSDLGKAIVEGGASAVSAGSLFVFQGRHRAVLISFPDSNELNHVFGITTKI